MPKVTIAIPTLNGSIYIRDAIQSALDQTYQDFELLVINNASTDNTEKIVLDFNDPRIRYYRNSEQVDIITNWNKCISKARGEYLLILGDDDLIYPNFINESIKVLQRDKTLGFVFSKCQKINERGEVKSPWGYDYLNPGKHSGSDYIGKTAQLGVNLTNSTTTLINLAAVNKVGEFKAEVAKNTFDFNMWLKIATHYDVYFIEKFLASYREHKQQVSEQHWRGKFPSGKIGAQLEILHCLDKINGTEEGESSSPHLKYLRTLALKRIAVIIEEFDPTF